MKHTTSQQVLAVALLFATATFSSAEVTYAAKGKYAGRVTIANKEPNTTVYIWQSDGQGGWVNTGSSIHTNGNGNGTVEISNVSSGTLLKGHQVKTGNEDHASNQNPAEVVRAKNRWGFTKWFASLSPGPNGPRMCSLYQNVAAGGHVYTETWQANTMLSARFNPSQAFWMNMGAQMTTTGDLQAQLMGITNDSAQSPYCRRRYAEH